MNGRCLCALGAIVTAGVGGRLASAVEFRPPVVKWEDTYSLGVGLPAGLVSLDQTADGGLVAAGSATEQSGGTFMYLLRTDGNGNELWHCTFPGGGLSSVGWSVQQTDDDGDGARDDGFIIAGSREMGEPDFPLEWYIVKTDAMGSEQWSRTVNIGNRGEAYDVRQTADGGFVAAGFGTQQFGVCYDIDAYVLKLDTSGDTQQVWRFGTQCSFACDPDCGPEFAEAVRQVNDDGDGITDDGFVFVGNKYRSCTDAGCETDFWMVRIDPNGNPVWEQTYGPGELYAVEQLWDGGFAAGGAGDTGLQLLRTEPTGAGIWQQALSRFTRVHCVKEAADGCLVVAGEYDAVSGSMGSLAKCDLSTGTARWTLGLTAGADLASWSCVQQAPDGGYVVAGYKGAPVGAWIVRTFRETVMPDLDMDNDVDTDDFGIFQGCFKGANRPYPPGCSESDFDHDNDVDLADFGVLQGCFSGPNHPPACWPQCDSRGG